MLKELRIKKIMSEERCCWEEAVKREKQRKSLNEFL